MTNFALRASVLVLAFAGFAGSTVLSEAAPTRNVVKPVVGVVVAPMCLPSDPTHCGMD